MVHLTFVTTNQGKVDFLRIVLEPLIAQGVVQGLDMHSELELVEVQANSLAEICHAKAVEAFKVLQRPLVVQDSGFAIAALNGFPGPYTKYVLETVGVDGLLKLMEGQTDRRCGFVACVGYADEAGAIRVFEEPRPYFGTLRETRASPLQGGAVARAWGHESSSLFEVFVPDDAACAGLALAEMTVDQLTEYRRTRDSAFKAFANWLRECQRCDSQPNEIMNCGVQC